MGLLRLVLLALVARAYAGPVSYSSETCATSCEENRHTFEPGLIYEYDLLTKITTSIPDGTENQSTLELSAAAHIDVLSSCELALRLQNIVLQEGGTTVNRMTELKAGLEENALRFSFSNGLVTGVCPKAAEPTWSLNIKRAILSSLQNTMTDFQAKHTATETDVIGICPVSYQPLGSTWNSYSVKKAKDVSSCSQPTQANTVFQTMSYNTPSKVKSLPILKSTHECEQEVSVEKGHITKSVCKEHHVFRPFSRGDSGATTTVEQSMTYKGQSRLTATRRQPVSLRTDLQYEHTEGNDIQENTQREIVATLQMICEVTKDGVQPEVPGLFRDLVKGMRQADLTSLISIGRQAKRLCNKAESLYHDAVPTLGTSAGVGLMRNLIRGGEVSKEESDMWLTSLAFIPKPDVTMLREVKPLLTMESIRRKAYLAVSSLVNTYCSQNENCENEVQEIMTIFQNNLGASCTGDRNVIMMSLKALGNTGLSGRVIDILKNCITNEEISTEIRVTAINAMRRMQCDADRTTLMQILQSTYADAELRINAYLVLMKCPSVELIEIVKQMLETEEINQVGSFIWTHLTNLMESASPLKKNIRDILQNAELKKAFDLDKRKYSRNIEWSTYSEAINTGIGMDSNLVWSSESFVPRSGMVNLTIDLFGQSVNLVELGGRVQGLDSVLENMFGDKKEGSAMTNDIIEDFDSTYRQPKTDPQGSYYIRIFGNEIKYDDFVGFDLENVKNKVNYLQWLIELAKEHNIDFTKSLTFLESELKVPTVAGMPLVLSVDGTATMDLQIKGKVDLMRLVSSPSELDIVGTVRPSAALEISSTMGVDVFVVKTGLKMVNTFHTSTLADGLIKLQDGKVFKMDINMPKENMEIFNAKTKFYIKYRGEDLEQQMTPEDRMEVHRCSGESVIRALGVELCADLSLPSLTKTTGPWFPLSGPMTAALSLKKRDSFTKYHVEARVVQDENRNEVVFAFNTPGSIYDREFLASFELNKQENNLRLDLRSPWKKVGIVGNLINQENLKKMSGQLSIDDVVQYSLRTGIHINQGRYAIRYTPEVELVLPGKTPMKLTGSAIYRENKKIDADVSVENVFKDTAIFKGLIQKIEENKKVRIETDMEVRVNSFKGQMSGFVEHLRTKDEIKTDTELTVRYRTDKGPQFISFAKQFHLETPNQRKSVLLASTVSSSLYPQLDSDMSLNMVTEGNEVVLSLNMGLTNDKPKRINADLQGKLEMTPSFRTAVIQGLTKLNVMGNELEATVDHMHNPNELQTSCMGRLGSEKATVEVNLLRRNLRPVDIAASAKLTYRDHEITYSQSMLQQGNTYNHELDVKINQSPILVSTSTFKTGHRYELSTDLTAYSLKPIHLEGLAQPDILNFLAQATCVYGKRTYSTQLQWQHTGVLRNFANKGNLKVVFEENKYELQSDVSVQDAKIIKVNFNSVMDHQNQGSKKIDISGTCVLSRTTPSLEARVQWWPNNFINGKINLKLDDNGLWSVTQNLEGSFILESSLFQTVVAAVKHEHAPGAVNFEGEVSWSPNKKIQLVFGLQQNNKWSEANINLLMNTPFMQFTKISTDLAYKLAGNKITTNGQLGLNNKVSTFDFTGVADWQNSAIDFKATTPFRAYENLALIIKNNHNGQVYASVIKFNVGPEEIFGLEFDMEHERRGYFMKNSGSLSLNLPIRRYQTNKISWNHDNSARNFNNRIVIEVRNQKLVFDFELRNRKVFSIKTKLLTPYFPDVYLSLDHQSERHKHVYQTTAAAQYGDDAITLDNAFSWLANSLTLKTKVTTPFTNYEEVNLDISNIMEGTTYEGRYQLKMDVTEYSLTGTIINNGMPAMKVDVVASCPHSGDLSLQFVNEKQGNIWVSSANMLYHRDKSISFVGKLGLNNLKKLSIDISTPYREMEKMTLDIEHQGPIQRFRTKALLSHNMLRSVVEFAAMVDVAVLNDVRLELTMKTPLQRMDFFKVIVTHKAKGPAYQTEASMTLSERTLSGSNVLLVNGIKDFTNRAKFNYDDEIMELEFHFNAIEDIVVYSKLKSTRFGEQEVTLKHKGTWKNFQSSLTASLTPSQVISAEAQFFFSGNNLNTEFKLATPFENVNIFEVMASHRGGPAAFENNLKVIHNSKLLVGRIRSDISNFHDIKIEVTGETPFDAFKSIMCEFKHKHVQQTHQTDFSFISPSQELVASHSLQIVSAKVFSSKVAMKYQQHTKIEGELKVDITDDVAIEVSLSNPWTGMHELSLMHKGTLQNFETTVNIKPQESENIAGYARFSLNGNRWTSLGKITSTYSQIQMFEVALTHNGPLQNFATEAKIDLNGKSNTANLVVNIQNVDNLNMKLTATMPIDEYEQINVAFTHRYARGICQSDLKAKVGSHNIAASNALQFTTDKMFNTKAMAAYQGETFAEVEVNFNAMRNIEFNTLFRTKWTGAQMASLNHQGNWKEFETTAKLSPMYGKTIVIYTQAAVVGNNISGKAKITTPYSELQIAEVSLNHEGELKTFVTNIMMNYNRKKVECQLSVNAANLNNLHLQVSGTTPFEGWEKVESLVTHNYAGQQCQTTFSADAPLMKVSFSNLIQRRALANFEVKTTLSWMEEEVIIADLNVNGEDNFLIQAHLENVWSGRHGLSLSHKGWLKNFKMEIDINTHDSQHIIGHAEFFMSGNELISRVKMTTPYSEVNVFEVSLKHKGRIEQFTNELTGLLNGQRVQLEIATDIINLNSITLTASAELPVEGFDKNEVRFIHKKTRQSYQTDLTMHSGMYKAAVSNSLKMTSKKIFSNKAALTFQDELLAKLQMEVDVARKIEIDTVFNSQWTGEQLLSLSHKGGWKNFETVAKLGLQKDVALVFNAKSTFQWNKLTGFAKITTPYLPLRNLDISVNHNGRPKSFVNNIVLIYNEEKLEHEMAVDVLDVEKMDIHLIGKTTVPGFEEISAVFQHKFKGRICKTELTLTSAFATVTASNIIQLKSRKSFSWQTSLSLPFEKKIDFELDADNDENIDISGKFVSSWTGIQTASLKHQGSLRNFQTTINLSPRQDENIIGRAQFNMMAGQVNGSMFITTSYPQLDVFEVRIHHQGAIYNFNSECYIDVDGHKNSVKITADFPNANKLSLNVLAMTSFAGFTRNDFLLTHSSDNRDYESVVKMQIEDNVYMATNILSITSPKIFTINTSAKNQNNIVAEFKLNVDAADKIVCDAHLQSQWSGKHTASMTYEGNWQNFQTKVEISPLEGDVITMNAKSSLQNYRYNGVMKISTSYGIVKIFEMSANHKGRLQKFNSGIHMNYNDNKLQGDLHVDVTNTNDIRVKVIGKTPFSGFENIDGIFAHQFTGNNCKTELVIESSDIKIAASNMVQLRSKASFNAKTSFKFMQRSTVDFELDVDLDQSKSISGKFESTWTGTQMVTFVHQGSWNDFQTTITVSPKATETVRMNMQVSLQQEKFNGFLKLSSPYDEMRKLEITMGHQGHIRKFTDKLEIQYNDETVVAEISADFTNLRDVNVLLKGQTSFEEIKTINSHFYHKIGQRNCQMEFVFDIPGKKIVASHAMEYQRNSFASRSSLDLMGKKTDVSLSGNSIEDFTFNGVLKSHYTGEQAIAITCHGDWKNFETSVTISPRKSEDIKTTIKFASNDIIDGSLQFESTYSDLDLSQFYFRHTGSFWKFNSELNMEHQKQKGTMNLSVDMSNCDNLAASVTLETPFDGMERILVALKHNHAAVEYSTEFNVEVSEDKLVAKNVLHLSERRAVKSETSIECSFMDTMSLVTNIDIDDDIAAHALFTSPWTGERRIDLTHKGHLKDFETDFKVTSPFSQTLQFNAQFSMDGVAVSGIAKLETEFGEVRNAQISLVHQGSVFNFENELSIKYNDEVASLKGKFLLDSSGIDGNFEMTTPITSLKQLSLTASHKGDLTKFDSKYELTYLKQKSVFTATYNFESGLVSGEFDLQSPYRAIQSAGVQFIHRGSLMEFQNSGKVNLNNKHYAGESVFSLKGKSLQFAVKMSLDHDYSMEIYHDGGLQQFSNNVTLRYNYEVIMAESNFKFSEGDLQTSINITTPFAAAKNMGLSYVHSGNFMSFECDLKMNIGKKAISGKHIWNFNKKAFRHSVTLTTPFPNYSELRYNLDHQEKRGMIKQSLLLGLEDHNLDVKTAFKKTTNKISGNVNVRTPFAQARRMSISFLHKFIDAFNFDNELSASLQSNAIVFSSSCSKKNNMIETNFNLETPFQAVPKMSGLFKHTGPLNGFSNELTITLDGATISGGTSFRLHDNAVSGDVRIRTPYRAMRLLDLQVSHYGSGLNFNNNMTAKYNRYTVTCASSMIFDANEVKAVVSLQTPLPGYRAIASGIYMRKEASGVNSELSMEIGSQKYSLRQRLLLRSTQSEGSLIVETPFLGYKDMGISFKHIGYVRNFNGEVTAFKNNRRLRGKLSFKMLGSKVDLKLSMETPYQGFTNAGVNLQHDGYFNDFYSVMSANLEDAIIETTGVLALHQERINANFTLQTPFPAFRLIKYTLAHSGNTLQFENAMSGTFNRYTIKTNGTFLLQSGNLEFNFNLQTPFEGYKTMVASLVHNGKFIPSESRCVINLEDMVISMNHDISYSGGKLDASLLIETPIPGYNRLGYSGIHNGDVLNFENGLKVFLDSSVIEGTSKFTLESGTMYLDVALKTPFKGCSTSGIVIKHSGILRKFNNEMKFYLENNDITSSFITDINGHNMNADLKIETPFQGINIVGATLRHQGPVKDFNNELTVYAEDQVFKSINSFTLGEQAVSADFKIKTPVRGFTTMGVTLRHRGPAINFNNQFKMFIENQIISTVGSLVVDEDRLSAEFTLVTPFIGYSIAGVSLKHQGQSTNFNNDLKLYIEENAIKSMIKLQIEDQTVSADFKLETPFKSYTTMGVAVNHEGSLRNFNNEIKLYLENSFITNTNIFQIGGQTVSADFKADTTFEGFSTIGFVLSHEGLARSFKNEMRAYVENKAVTSVCTLQIERRVVSADLKIQTPFTGFGTMGVTVKHQGLLKNFKNEVDMYIEQKMVTSINSFEMDGRTIAVDIEVKTPFDVAQVLAGKFTHSGHIRNFNNNLKATYNTYTFETRNSFILNKQKMVMKTILDTPVAGYRNMGFTFKRTGEASDFSVEITCNKEDFVISGQCTSKVTPTTYTMNGMLTGPFGEFETAVNHEGTIPNFKTEASFRFNSHHFKVNTEVERHADSITASASVTMPQKYGIVFEHKGPWTGFNNKVHLIIADQPHIATSSFKYDAGIDANLKVESSQYPVTFSFNHVGRLLNFRQSSSLSIIEKMYGHKCEFMLQGRKVLGVFVLDTPHKEFQTASVKVEHQGRWNNFENQLTLELNERKINANSQFLLGAKRIKGGIFVRIPEEYSIEIIQKGPKADMTAIAKLVTDNKKSQLSADFKRSNGVMDGNFNLRSPYIGGNIASVMNYNRRQGTFIASLNTPFDELPQMNAMISHQGNKNEFKTTAKLVTPFTMCQDISFEFNHKGHLVNFAQNGFLKIDDKQFSGDVSFVKNRQNLQATLNMKTPFSQIESGHLVMNHRGALNDFNSDIVVEWNDQKMEGAVDFRKAETIQGSASFTTPFKPIRQLTVNFNHQGNLGDFSTSSEANLNGQMINGSVSFVRKGTVLESTGTFNSPFQQLRTGSYQVNHRGYFDDFVTTGQIKFDDKVIAGEVIHKRAPEIMTTARLSTPWTPLREAKVSFNHRGHLMDFTTIVSGELNGDIINGNIAFMKATNKLETSAKIQTPFEIFPELAYTYVHNVQPSAVKAASTLTLPLKVYKNFGAEFDISGSSDNFRSVLKFNSPFTTLPEGVIRVSHKGGFEIFTTHCSFIATSRNIESEINVQRTASQKLATIKISSPYRELRDFYFEAKNDVNGPEMVTHIEATYNGEKHFDTDFTINTGDLTYATLNIHAPVNVEIRGRNRMRSKEMSLNIPSVVSLTTSYQKDKGKFTHATMLQLGSDARNKFSYSVESATAHNGNEATYGGQLNLESRHGKFESAVNHIIKHSIHQYLTNVKIQQLQLSSDMTLQNSMKSVFKASHPSLNKDIVFGLEGSMIDAYRCKLNLEYDDQKFEFIGKLSDQSPSQGDTKYVAEAHLTHPASHLDFQFTSQVTNNVEKMGGNMEVKYMMTRDRQLRSNALRAEINKIREELNLEVDTPVKRMSMSGRRLSEGNGKHFAVSGTIDDHDMSADLKLTSDLPGFDVSLQLDSDKKIMVSGKYEEPSSFHLEAFREESGRKIRESEMSVKLSSENLLSAKVFINPNIYSELKRLFGIKLGLKRMVNDVYLSLNEELRYKKELLAHAFKPLKSAWEEITAPVISLAMELYERNDYYVRDVVDHINDWRMMMSDRLKQLKSQYTNHFANKYATIQDAYNKTVDQMQDFLDNIVIPYAASAYVKIMKTLDYIHSHPMLESAWDWLLSLDIEKHYNNFKYYVVDMIVKYNAMLDHINNFWEKFNNIPGMSFLVRTAKAYVNALRWVYDVTELDRLVQALMSELRAQGWQTLVNWWHSHCESIQPHVTRYVPEQGEYEIQMKMPVSFTKVSGLPDWPVFKHWDKIKKIASKKWAALNKYDFSFANSWAFWDLFYAYKPSSNPLDWIPPFKTHATVAGAQHIMTFDKKFYEFVGECSYLLARDFIDGKFSVLINYDNVNGIMTKKSITVHSGDKELEIMSDFKVKLNGRERDLPIKYRHTVIRRIGNMIQLDNDHGLGITCDLPHDRCTVKVTGWYYGKTGGLFGTYDNEKATDFHTADRRHTKSLEDFTLSWSSGSRCRAVNTATEVQPSTSSPEYAMCAKYFERQTSPFRLCFGQMEPSTFMTMCMNEIARSTDMKTAACKIASFYVEECNMAYVPLRLPKDCVTCITPSGKELQEGESITILGDEVPKAADVVFVMSHKSCNREVTAKVGSIAQQLNRNFKQAGVSDVRIGLVGYGLPGVLNAPHSHTIDGEIFNDANKVKSVMENFPITDEETNEDTLAAILFASQYPFRAGASKSIILLPCESCTENEMTYTEIQHLLQYNNINLHLLLNHTFQLRTAATKTAYIFGVDNNGLFTPRSVNDEALTGDMPLRRQVIVPKDLCAALSQETDGVIFSVNQLLQSRTVVQKKFTDVFTRLVAKKGAPANCQTCECVADATGVGISKCKSCAPVNKPWIEDQEDEKPVQVKKKQTRRIRNPRRKNKKSQTKA